MPTSLRPRTQRQIKHPASRCRSHRLDKKQGEARKETTWLGVNTPKHPSPQRSFGTLQGHEYINENGSWRLCKDPEEFADYLEREAKTRSWYLGQTKRMGVPIQMRRPAQPLEILTTSFAPWLSDWTEADFAAGRDPRPKLGAIRNLWLEAAMKALSGVRMVLGYALHTDTDDLHFDLCLSRQDGHGGRVGATGLHTVGPWCVGVDRQVRSGATILPDKADQLKRAVGTFRRRYGHDAKPLDVVLARSLDMAADAVLGAELRPYIEAYSKSVPELERRHAAAQLAILEKAKAKVLQQSALEATGNEISLG